MSLKCSDTTFRDRRAICLQSDSFSRIRRTTGSALRSPPVGDLESRAAACAPESVHAAHFQLVPPFVQ